MDRFPVPMPRPLRLAAALLIASVIVGCDPIASTQGQFDLNTIATIPAAEREALVALYSSTDGEAWID